MPPACPRQKSIPRVDRTSSSPSRALPIRPRSVASNPRRSSSSVLCCRRMPPPTRRTPRRRHHPHPRPRPMERPRARLRAPPRRQPQHRRPSRRTRATWPGSPRSWLLSSPASIAHRWTSRARTSRTRRSRSSPVTKWIRRIPGLSSPSTSSARSRSPERPFRMPPPARSAPARVQSRASGPSTSFSTAREARSSAMSRAASSR